MARHLPTERLTGCAVTLLAACVLCVLPARAQDDPPPTSPANLDPQVVSKLLKKDDPPDYPPLAKLNYIQGSVRLRICVARDGRVSEAHVIQGHPFLAVSALKAVRSWVYRPYRVGMRAIEFSTVVDFRFTLRPKTLALLPPSAEKDLRERITPPEVEKQSADPPSDDHVILRILVDSEGRALDTQLISGNVSNIREAEQEVSHWTFRPARWGALAVPWYLEVDVPVRHWPA
jgi:TonB family protein